MSSFQNDNQWSQGPTEPTEEPNLGSRVATFDDVFENLSFATELVFKPGVIVYYVTHAVVGGGTYFAMIIGLVMSMGMWQEFENPGSGPPEPEFGALFALGMVGILIFVMILGGLGAGPMAPIRRAARGDMAAVQDIGTTFKQSIRAGLWAIPIMFIVNIVVTIGTVLLILPGLAAAFFLTPAIYLVVTEQAGVFESISMSFNWVKKHAGAVGALWVALIGGYFVLFGLVFCLSLIPFVGSLIALPIQLAGYAFFFVVYVAAMLTIDSAENGWRLGASHEGIEQVFE